MLIKSLQIIENYVPRLFVYLSSRFVFGCSECKTLIDNRGAPLVVSGLR